MAYYLFNNDNIKKRYTVTDNKTGYTNNYSWFMWNLAWWLVFLIGLLTGLNLG